MVNSAKKIKIFIIVPNFNIEKKSIMNVRMRQPLSEAIIAAILRQRGYEIKLLDANVLNLPTEEILKAIADFQPDALLATTTPIDRWECPNSHIDNIFSLIDRALAKHKIIIGSHGTAMPQWVFENCGADFVIRGEPELAVGKLIGFLAGDADLALSEISGLSYREAGAIKNNPGERINDLDILPLPAYDLLPMEKYSSNGYEEPFAIVMTSRGCPFNCTFCLKAMAPGPYIVRSIPKVMEELEYLIKNFQIKSIFFQDWEFFIDSRRVEQICREILARGLKFSWGANARATDIVRSRNLMPLLKQAGCVAINMGLESVSDRVLQKINKQIGKADLQQAVDILKSNNLAGGLYMLLNAPGETWKTIRETQDFVAKNKLRVRPFLKPIPYPGTILFEELKKIFPRRRIDWSNVENYAGTIETSLNPKSALFYLRSYKIIQKYGVQVGRQIKKISLLAVADLLGFASLFRLARRPKAIVVFFNGKLGDMVCVTPVFKALKNQYPDHQLIVFARRGFLPIWDGNPSIDQKIGFAGEKESGSFSWLIRQWRRLNHYSITVYFNLVNNFEGGILGVAVQAKKRVLVTTNLDGVALRLLYPYYDACEYKFDRQIKEFYFDILTGLGAAAPDKKNELFFAGQAEEAEAYFKNNDLENKIIVGLAVSSGKEYFKIWPADYWAELIGLLTKKYQAKILIFGLSEDQPIIDGIIKQARVDCLAVLDRPLNLLPHYLKKLKLFVSVDTGPLYIADALGVPVVDIIGVCDENTQRPENNYRLVTNREVCPAYSKMLDSPIGHLEEMRRCYESITPEQVFAHCQELIDKNNK